MPHKCVFHVVLGQLWTAWAGSFMSGHLHPIAFHDRPKDYKLPLFSLLQRYCQCFSPCKHDLQRRSIVESVHRAATGELARRYDLIARLAPRQHKSGKAV